jgi:ligand-binding sensor domain-containing protein
MFLERRLFSVFVFRQSKYVFIALLFLLVEAATLSYAQSEFSFKPLNRQTGLLGDLNLFIFRDSKKFIWISSKQGLNRFDGKKVKTYEYDSKKNNSLRGSNIQSLFFEDKNGDIWFTTSEAINVYRRYRDNFDHFYLKDAKGNLLKNEYYAFHLDTSGFLWLRIGDYKNAQLYCFNTNSHQTTRPEELKHEEAILSDFMGLRTVVDPTYKGKGISLLSFFWGGKLGIREYQYDEKRKLIHTQPYFSGLKNDVFSSNDTFTIKQIVYDTAAKGFWLASQRGLLFWNKKAGKYTLIDSFNKEKIYGLTDIVLYKDQLLVSSKTFGVLVFNKKKQKFSHQILPKHTDTEGGQLKKFDNLYLDKEDNLWLSSSDNGLFYTNLRRPKFDLIRFPSTSLNTTTDNIIEDNVGNKWIARRGAGIVVFDRQHQVIPNFFSKNFSDFIRCLYKDRDGVIWALTTGTHPALYRYNPSSRAFDAINFADNQRFDSFQLYDICQISDGRLLIGSSKGVFQLDKSVKRPMLEKCPILGITETEWDVVDIFEDQYKTIFFNQNSQNLFTCRREETGIRRINETAINAKTVSFIEQNNQLWLASNKGLLVFNHTFEQLTPLSPHLLGLTVEGILRDTTGHFWLTTSEGILNFDPKTGNYHRYTTADLMQGYNFGYSALADKDGYFWFGGTNGINVFKPSEVKNFPFAPRPHITDILVNNVPYRPDTSIVEKKRLVLPYDSNTVRLDFTAVEFSDAPSDSISYTFNLAHVDSTKWVWTTTANAADPSVSFVNLTEGDYVLRLKAVNSDGVWSEMRTLELRILPPWYRTWWFYTFLAAVALGITYSVVLWVIYLREKRLKAQAAFEQKIKETELQVLRLQMNPHFIFNALNSIRAFVLDNTPLAASKYLADFGYLMRKILEYSTQETISLDKEEEILRGYLEMEQLRSDFEFTIEFTDDPDIWDIEVPPMILQPFVENAILHGIASKQNDAGIIWIRFDIEGDAILCSVQDNGVGMGNSHRSKEQKAHISKSRAITQDRLDIITQLTGKPTALIFENIETGGTKVTIRLPIEL